jgi:GntR family transcriptional regulator/MocR family aminotransferase
LGITTRVTIARDSDVPLYRQLRQALEHEIATGALDPELPLPSSRELARELGLSRNTVNAAYSELEAEGFVEAKARQGLYVNSEMVAVASSATQVAGDRPVDWSRHVSSRPDEAIPEIEKVRDWHRYPYPFVGGQVDVSSFPRLAWARTLRQALEPPHLHHSLRDGIDEDDPELLEMLCRHVLPGRGIEVDPSHVLVTLGSQQGLDLLAHSLVRPGAVVAVEDPGYPDMRHIVSRAGAQLRYLPVDESGVLPPADLAGVSLLALTPSHHSPTNVTLSVARRRVLLSMATTTASSATGGARPRRCVRCLPTNGSSTWARSPSSWLPASGSATWSPLQSSWPSCATSAATGCAMRRDTPSGRWR